MLLSIGNDFEVNKKPVSGSLELESTGIHLVLGNNGVGKTSLFRYFLEHQKQLGLAGQSSFFSQYRITPVGGMRVEQLFRQLHKAHPQRVEANIEQHPLFEAFAGQSLMEKSVSSLSGGENQVVKLLLGFSLRARYYFLDEPFQFLDSAKFQVLFQYLVQRQEGTLVIIDHRNPELQLRARACFELVDLGDHIELRRQNAV